MKFFRVVKPFNGLLELLMYIPYKETDSFIYIKTLNGENQGMLGKGADGQLLPNIKHWAHPTPEEAVEAYIAEQEAMIARLKAQMATPAGNIREAARLMEGAMPDPRGYGWADGGWPLGSSLGQYLHDVSVWCESMTPAKAAKVLAKMLADAPKPGAPRMASMKAMDFYTQMVTPHPTPIPAPVDFGWDPVEEQWSGEPDDLSQARALGAWHAEVREWAEGELTPAKAASVLDYEQEGAFGFPSLPDGMWNEAVVVAREYLLNEAEHQENTGPAPEFGV